MQEVLPEAGAEMETPHERDELRIEADDSRFIRRRFTFLLNEVGDFGTSFLNNLFYLGRLNAPVTDELLERNLCNSAAKRIKRGERNSVRHGVDEDIDARHALKRFNIAPFFPDDLSFDFI